MVGKTRKGYRLDLLALLAPRPVDEHWEADKAGWRSFVMGNPSSYDPGSRLQAAWQRGYDAAARSSDPVGLML